MLMFLRSRVWNGFLLAALLLSLAGALVTPSPARAGDAPPEYEYEDDLATPLAVEVTMVELPSVGKSAEVTMVVSSTEPADGVQVALVMSEGLRIDGERAFALDLRAGEAHTLTTSVTPEVAGNHSVAVNVSLDFGDGTVWGDSDGVYFSSDEGTASEGFSYQGDPTSIAAVPGPGNTMKFESEAFPDGSMPVMPIDENLEIPVDTGEPGGRDDAPREGEVALAAGMLTIRGNVGMYDRNANWKNQKLLVQMTTSGGTHIAFTYSDFNGNFVFKVSNPGAFRIRFWAYYRESSMTVGAIRVVRNGTETPSRFSLAGWNHSTPAMGPAPDGEYNIGSWTPASNWSTNRAWWVYQDLVDGFFSTWFETPPSVPAGSRQPDGVTVEWQPDSTGSPHYNRESRRAHLSDVDANSGHVVVHEYGHAAMHNVYGVMPPSDCPAKHFIEQPSALTCAWTEGWADFFAIFVQRDPIFTRGCALPCTPPSINMEIRFSTSPLVLWEDGDLVEGNVAASLWDFIDPANEPFEGTDKTDSTSTPFRRIWDVVFTQNHNTFHEFWDDFSAGFDYSTFAQSLATLDQNTLDYGWKAICGDWARESDDSHKGITSVALPESPPEKRYFCTDHDTDWYRLDAAAGTTFVIETADLSTASNGTIADTTLTLYRVDDETTFTQLAYDDNGGSENLASRLVYTTQASSDLRVAVRHKDGLGHPFYSYTVDFRVAIDNDAPMVTAPIHRLIAGRTLLTPAADIYTVDVRAEWTASDPDDGIAFQSLQWQVNAQGFTMLEPSLEGNVREYTVPMTIGTTNQLQVSATDSYWASSGYATGASFDVLGYQETDFSYEGAWTSHDATAAWGGSYVSTNGEASPMIAAAAGGANGAYATVSFTGVSVALVGMLAPDGGYAEIYIDGELHGRADFYSVREMSRQVVFAVNDLAAGAHHTLEVRWTPYSNEWSSGYQLYLDGLIALD